MTALITQITDWQTLAPAELRGQLGEMVEAPTNVQITLSEIRGVLEPADYAMVRLTLEQSTVPASDELADRVLAAEMADAMAAMRTVGLNLSAADRQAVIDSLAAAGQWPDAVRDVVKALGVVRQPRWQKLGYESLPALEDVDAEQSRELAKNAITDRINAAKAAMSTAYDAGQSGVGITAAAEAAWAGE